MIELEDKPEEGIYRLHLSWKDNTTGAVYNTVTPNLFGEDLDPIRDVLADLSDRMRAAEIKNAQQDVRLNNIETKNTQQDTSISGLQTRVGSAETKLDEHDIAFNNFVNLINAANAKIMENTDNITNLQKKNDVQDQFITQLDAKNGTQDTAIAKAQSTADGSVTVNNQQNIKIDSVTSRVTALESIPPGIPKPPSHNTIAVVVRTQSFGGSGSQNLTIEGWYRIELIGGGGGSGGGAFLTAAAGTRAGGNGGNGGHITAVFYVPSSGATVHYWVGSGGQGGDYGDDGAGGGGAGGSASFVEVFPTSIQLIAGGGGGGSGAFIVGSPSASGGGGIGGGNVVIDRGTISNEGANNLAARQTVFRASHGVLSPRATSNLWGTARNAYSIGGAGGSGWATGSTVSNNGQPGGNGYDWDGRRSAFGGGEGGIYPAGQNTDGVPGKDGKIIIYRQ